MAVPGVNTSFILFLSLIISAAMIAHSDDDCVYTVYIRTGSIWKGGTDSIISLNLFDSTGSSFYISNLVKWGGVMGSGHHYYERGNLDIFSGRGYCLNGPVCAINLTSDGSGPHHGWYCNYVEVTTTGVHRPCSQKLFNVEQWLATDVGPYELSVTKNLCDVKSDDGIIRSVNGV